jgi:hypothetical protein
MATTPLMTRVREDHLELFRKACEKIDRDPNNVVRELIHAFGEERIRIVPSEGQKKERELYHES